MTPSNFVLMIELNKHAYRQATGKEPKRLQVGPELYEWIHRTAARFVTVAEPSDLQEYAPNTVAGLELWPNVYLDGFIVDGGEQ